MLIARTKEKESCSEDGVFWVREFRVRHDKYKNKFVLEDRYLSRIGDKWYARELAQTRLFTDPETTWHMWSEGETAEEAIESVIGDTSFLEADSLEPIHAEIVARARAERAEGERRYNLTQRRDDAIEEYRQWKIDRQREFNKKYSSLEGDKFTKAFERTKKRLQPEHDAMVAKINELRAMVTWK